MRHETAIGESEMSQTALATKTVGPLEAVAVPSEAPLRLGVDFHIIPTKCWSTGKSWPLTPQQQVLCEWYLKGYDEGFDFDFIKKRMLNWFKMDLNRAEMLEILSKGHVAEHLKERLEEKGILKGLTLEAYVAWAYRVQAGEIKPTEAQVFTWKHLSRVMGFEKQNQSLVQNNLQINFLQANGEA